MRTVHLDGWLIEDQATCLAAIAEALAFPDYFGMNLDALWDSLADVDEPTEVVWHQHERYASADPEGFQEVRTQFEETDAPVKVRLA